MEKSNSKFKIKDVVIFSTYQGFDVGCIVEKLITFVGVKSLITGKLYRTGYTSIKLVDLTFKYII
jgi:hypothetical protein